MQPRNKRPVPEVTQSSPDRQQQRTRVSKRNVNQEASNSPVHVPRVSRLTSSRTLSGSRFVCGDTLYYYQRQTSHNQKMVVPGVVLETFAKQTTQMVRIKYWYQGTGGRWSVFPSSRSRDFLEMPMASALLHPRTDDAGSSKKMLSNEIMSAKYNGIDSWIVRHERACKDKEDARIKTEARAKIQAEKDAKEAAVQAKKEKEANVLSCLNQVIALLTTLNGLIVETPAASNWPNCVLTSEKFYREATKNLDNTVKADQIGPWGRTTPFQKTLLQQITTMSKLTGQILSTGHALTVHTEHNALRMIKNNDDGGKQFTHDELCSMSMSIPMVQPFQALITEMTKADTTSFRTKITYRQTNQQTNQLRMFMLFCFTCSMSGIKFRHPTETTFTKDLLKAGCERNQIKEIVRDYAFGVTPETAEQMSVSKVFDLALQYNLPPDFKVYSKVRLARMLKIITDNFGQKSAAGKYMTGCTVIIIATYVQEANNPEFFKYLLSASKEEISMKNAGIESTEDIGSTAAVDLFCQMFVLFNIVHIASLRDKIKAAESRGKFRTDLKKYAKARLNKFSEYQSHRRSRNRGPANDGRIVDVNLSSFYYPQCTNIDGSVVGQSVWERTARPFSWGHVGFGNIVQNSNLNKFAHMYDTAPTSNEKIPIVADPSDPNVPSLCASGDAAPTSRFERVLLMQRDLIASGKGNTIIDWDSPMEQEQTIDPEKDTIEWIFADGVKQVAHEGDRLTYTGFEDECVVLVSNDCEEGKLVVLIGTEETKTMDASLFKKWCPGKGDKHDMRHSYYQFIKSIIGLFHVLMAAMKRSLEVNRKTLKILVGLFRSFGQVEFILNGGKYEVCYSELGAVVVAIMSFTEYVYRLYCTALNESPTPEGQANWMNKVRNKSGAWDQLFNICDNYFAIKALQDATRSADVNAIVLALGRLVELFALVGARDYFHLVTGFLLKQKTMSPYKLALQARSLMERYGLVFRSNDRFLENIQGASARGRGVSHGLIHGIKNMQRSFDQMQSFNPNLGGIATSNPSTAELGSQKIDLRISNIVLRFFQEESGLDDLSDDAKNLISGQLIFDTEDVVHDFAGQTIKASMKHVEDVSHVQARSHWDVTVFSDKCNSVTMRSIPNVLPTRLVIAQEEKVYQKSLIEMCVMKMWTDMVIKPKENVWYKQIIAIMDAAKDCNAGQYNQRVPPALKEIANLPLTGTGSRKTNDINREKYNKWVPKSNASEIVLVRAICRIKLLGIMFAREVLQKFYSAGNDSDLAEKVASMKDGAMGIEARRAVALEEINKKELNLTYKPIAPANEVQKAEKKLLDFIKARPTRRRPFAETLADLKKFIKPLSISMDDRRAFASKQKPLTNEQVTSLSKASDIYTTILRAKPLLYSRAKQMAAREIEMDIECMEIGKATALAAIERQGKPSRWDNEDRKIPLSASVSQSIEQAHREGEKVNTAAAVALVNATIATEAQHKKEAEAKQQKIKKQIDLKALGAASLIPLGSGKLLTKKQMQSLVENWSPLVLDNGDLQLTGHKDKMTQEFNTFKGTDQGKAMMKAGKKAFEDQEKVHVEQRRLAKERKANKAKEKKEKGAKAKKQQLAKKKKEQQDRDRQQQKAVEKAKKMKELTKKHNKRKAAEEQSQEQAKKRKETLDKAAKKDERRTASRARREAKK